MAYCLSSGVVSCWKADRTSIPMLCMSCFPAYRFPGIISTSLREPSALRGTEAWKSRFPLQMAYMHPCVRMAFMCFCSFSETRKLWCRRCMSCSSSSVSVMPVGKVAFFIVYVFPSTVHVLSPMLTVEMMSRSCMFHVACLWKRRASSLNCMTEMALCIMAVRRFCLSSIVVFPSRMIGSKPVHGSSL